MSKKYRILLVEDNPINQKVTQIQLEGFPCSLDIADDGQGALLQLENNYDAIIMDLGLPDITGIELCKEIIARAPNCSLLGFTAHILDKDRQAYFDAGMKEILTKPIKTEQLHATLENYLNDVGKNPL